MSYRILVWISEDSECRIGHTSDELRCTKSQIVTSLNKCVSLLIRHNIHPNPDYTTASSVKFDIA